MENKDKELAEYIVNKHEKLKTYKSSWESHWKELATYYLPEKDSVWGGATPGEKKGQTLYDSTGRRNSERLASALHGMLTNPSVQWFQFSTGDHLLDTTLENATWLQDTAKTINGILNHSNFQSEIHEVYLELCSLHTSYLRIEEDADEVVRFQSRPIYDCSISENYRGVIDTTYHEYKRTIDQLYGEYGDKLPQEVLDLRAKDPLKEYTIVHAVEPSKTIPDKLRHPSLPFTSVKVLKEMQKILAIEGFQENPCIISRFYKLAGEMYGRGPAMYALPDVKTANQMMKVWLEGAQLAINPPLQVPDEGVLLPVRFTPGGTNYYRADSKDRIEPIMTGANPQIGNDIIELLHSNIAKAFYIDQLHLVESDRMTATEVQMRRDEQLRTLSPIIGRLMYELHAPIIVRVMGVASRRGLIKPPPASLAKSKLDIKFVSALARAQESIEGDAAVRSLQTVMQFAQADPTIINSLDLNATAKFIYKSYGAPLHLLRSDEEVKAKEDEQKAMQQKAQQAQMDQVNSQTSKNMADAESVGAETQAGMGPQ